MSGFKSRLLLHWSIMYNVRRSIRSVALIRDFGRCNPVKIGNLSPERAVPSYIQKPPYYHEFIGMGNTTGDPEVKNEQQIKGMRASGKIAAKILNESVEIVKEGFSTDEIDGFIHERIIASNAYPSPLRYAGFPKSICTSVNNVACHGIPDDRKLLNGDIINVDITVYHQGYHADCSKTFMVGDVDSRGLYLVISAWECLKGCINLCHPGTPFKEIGAYITKFCKKNKLGVIPSFIGHGIGSYFHGPPEILHYQNDVPGKMQPGMTFTIEPILTLGGSAVNFCSDGWTVMSRDGARSAQFEHTVLITETGADVLTSLF